MKIRQIVQIEYSQEEYELYLKDREYLISQGYSISDYSECGFVLCEWVVDERDVKDLRKQEKR